jgi:hypothetical protein
LGRLLAVQQCFGARKLVAEVFAPPNLQVETYANVLAANAFFTAWWKSCLLKKFIL